jgi:hypothetical protein
VNGHQGMLETGQKLLGSPAVVGKSKLTFSY